MQKRGVSTILMVFELVAAVVIIIAMMRLAEKMASADISKTDFIIKESALMVETLHAVPEDVSVNYAPINMTTSFKLVMVKDSVTINVEPAKLYEANFRLGVPKIKPSEAIVRPKTEALIIFEKTNDEISFRNKDNG